MEPRQSEILTTSGAQGTERYDLDNTADPSNLELELLQKIRVAIAATLHMLECIRDDIQILAQRMDRLCSASRECRKVMKEQGQHLFSRPQIHDP